MSLANLLGLEPPTVLCDRCQNLDLVGWFYPPDDSYFPAKPAEPLSWPKTVEHQEDCTFCAFMISSLKLDPAFGHIFEDNFLIDEISLYPHKIGSIKIADIDVDGGADDARKAPGWIATALHCQRYVQSITLRPRMINKITHQFWGRGPSIKLLPCSTRSGELENLLHWQPETYSKIDVNVVRRWISSCCHHHQDKCNSAMWQNIHDLRMIDILEGCVVSIAHKIDYCALSYCWGHENRVRPRFKLTSKTISYLEQPGVLGKLASKLPQTVQDAMTITERLGYRYLWIDALCIVQDDAVHRSAAVSQMDKIYSGASLTIVAASGLDVWAGLPGLHYNTRTVRDIYQNLGSVELLARWPESSYPVSLPPQWPWNQRAWTFQEQVLSNRLLIFTESELLWECKTQLWAEGMHLQANGVSKNILVSLEENRIAGMKPSPDASAVQICNFCMAAASSRKLKYDGDRLECITGLLNTLRPEFPSGFFYGLPIDILDCALNFHCGMWDRGPFDRRSMFPSWCWAAHKCQAQSSIAGKHDSGFMHAWVVQNESHYAQKTAAWLRKEVAFHCIDKVTNSWMYLDSCQISADGSVHFDLSMQMWQNNDPAKLLRDAISRCNASNPNLAEHVLAGFCQVVDLIVDRTDSQQLDYSGRTGSSMYAAVRGPTRQVLRNLALTQEHQKQRPEALEFLLLTQHRRWEKQIGPIFEIMYIQQEQGLTRRIQMVQESVITPCIWSTLGAKWEFSIMV